MEDQRPQKRSPLATNALSHAAAWLCLVHLLMPAFGLVLGESSRAGHAAFVAAGAGCHLPTFGRAAPRAKMARSPLQHAGTSPPPMVKGLRAGGTKGIESAAAGVQLEETAAMDMRVLSFDLDGTLWPTQEVVWAANEKMAAFLNERYPGTPSAQDVQTAMKAIRQRRREEAQAAGTQAAPVSYTELRKSALELVTAEAGFPDAEAAAAAQAAFQVWLDERNAAAGRLLFDGVQDMLADIRRRFPSLLVCAITNGRGDVSKIPELAPLFDFSVSGEDAHVFPERKPSVKIYHAAVNQALACTRGSGVVLQHGDAVHRPAEGGEAAAAFEHSLAGWVHVGDDLANDIGPARQLGMRTVLVEVSRACDTPASTRVPVRALPLRPWRP